MAAVPSASIATAGTTRYGAWYLAKRRRRRKAAAASTPTNAALREDGTTALREDGTPELRE